MNTKLLTAAGALLLLATAITPAVLGHDDQFLCPNPTDPVNDPDPEIVEKKVCGPQGSAGHRYPLSYGGNHDEDGVAGTYVGAAGPAYAPNAYVRPQDTIAAGAILCDAEVVTDDNTSPDNEEAIDGVGTFGELPDGTWDDGGIGGACHTRNYTTPKFNTPGCPGGHSVRGTNGLGYDIWVGAACDWKTTIGGPGPAEALILCLINAALAFNPLGNLVAEATVIAQCILDFGACILTFPICAGPDPIEQCGGDNSADAVDFGYGWGTNGAIATFPGPLLTANTVLSPPPVACPQAGMTESIYVFDTVSTNTGVYVDLDGSPADPDPNADNFPPVWVPTGEPDLYPALTGKVWTVIP